MSQTSSPPPRDRDALIGVVFRRSLILVGGVAVVISASYVLSRVLYTTFAVGDAHNASSACTTVRSVILPH